MSAHEIEASDGNQSIADRLQTYLTAIDDLSAIAQQESAVLESELVSITAELERLENRRREIRVQMSEVESGIQAGLESRISDLTNFVVRALEQQFRAFDKRLTDYDRALSIIEKREKLLASDSKLANRYDRYVKMSMQMSEKLKEFDDFPEYAQALHDTHASMRESLSEMLALDTDIEAAGVNTLLAFELLCLDDGENLQLVMPCFAESIDDNPKLFNAKGAWLESAFHAFMTSDLLISDFEEATWGPFVSARIISHDRWTDANTLAMLASSICSELVRLTHVDLRATLRIIHLPVSMMPPERIAMNPTFGDREQHEPVQIMEPESEPDQYEVLEDGEQADEKWINPWIKRSDVREWRRKAPLAAESKWTPHARRVRTLLLRMLGNGAIGSNELVPLKELLQGLPDVDRADLQLGIEQMIEFGFLQAKETNGAQKIGIAPERLEMAGDLIIRDVTGDWERLFQIQGKS